MIERPELRCTCSRGSVTLAGLTTAFAVVLLSTDYVFAAPPPLAGCVPADAVAVYFGPGPRTAPAGTPGNAGAESAAPSRLGNTVAVLSFLAERAVQSGLLSGLDRCSRMWFDGLATLPIVDQHPYTIALLDIQSRARADGGNELAELQAAIILHTNGANEQIERRIQHLLSTYTNTDDTRLIRKSAPGGWAFTLADRRLPPWATITWGAMGDYFVAAIGKGAFDRIGDVVLQSKPGAAKRGPSLATDSWFVRALDEIAHYQASPPAAVQNDDRFIALLVNMQKLEQCGDALLARKIERIQASLDLAQAQRALWFAKRCGRAIEIRGIAQVKGKNKIGVLAGSAFEGAPGQSVIPPDATGYAVLNLDPKTAFPAMCEAYLAMRSPHAQARSRAFWRDVEIGATVSIERDIVAHLSGPVVIHNYPQQALGLPLAWTIYVPVHDAETVRNHIARLLRHAEEMVDQEGILRLRHEELEGIDPPGGVWYLRFGVDGPSLAVTERWLIISFAPHAIRTNVSFLSARRGQ